MNRLIHIFAAKNAFVTLMVTMAIVLALLAPKAAINVDEQLHYPHAKKVVNWYFTGGKDDSSLHTPKTNLKYYGQSVDNFTALINRVFKIENEYLTRHFTGALMFWLLLLFSGLTAKKITGSWNAAVLTVFAVVFMPRLFGQAFGNLKDIPFAAGYVAGILMIIQFIKEMPDPRWRTAILLGLSIAFTVSVRAGGFILFFYLGLCMIFYLSLKPFELKQIVSTKPVFVRLLGQGVVILIIGYFAGLLFWPYALQDVFVHPLESLKVMEHYKVSIRQIFEGDYIWSTNLPWYYLPKWLLISTPVYLFLGTLVFIGLFIKKLVLQFQSDNQLFFDSLLLFTFLFPAVYVVFIGSNLYSGIRQMLFILPPLAIGASVGIYRLFNSDYSVYLKYPVPVLFVLLMFLPLKHQGKTFPVDYVYFNSVSGGNKEAWSNYEYDYYFHAIKKPVEYLKEITENENDYIVATNSNLSNYFDNDQNLIYEYCRYLERSSKNWDYAIFGVNYLHPYLLKNNKWQSSETIQTFYHKGNPVAVLLKRKDKNGFEGIKALEDGRYYEAEELLKKALENEPNNVWLYVNLAKTSLFLEDEDKFEKYVKAGREIYPEYEPFYLLEAKQLFDNNEYKMAQEKINELLKINARYEPAAPLLKAINKKLKTEINKTN